MESVFIIAEAGVNHNASLERAHQLIEAAAKSGVNAIKFQTAVIEEEVSEKSELVDYQKKNNQNFKNQLELAQKVHLPNHVWQELKDHTEKLGLVFMSSAFSVAGVSILAKLGMEIYKIPSGEVTNLPYLRKIAKVAKEVILSTGMANLKEIEEALNVLQKEGLSKDNITVLHCNTEYPTSFSDVNLKAMLHIREELGVKIGYSDHTIGIEVPIAAVSLGAVVIEKHFTLDKNLPGPDHQASIEPGELKSMVRAIRNIELALGNGFKEPSESELKNMKLVRKSIVAKIEIQEGEIFSESNLSIKRPGTGISPMNWDNVIGKTSKYHFKKDDQIII
jgi:N,N'-diacetyllegionaminate synthase